MIVGSGCTHSWTRSSGSASSATRAGPRNSPRSPWFVEHDKDFQWIYRFLANPGDAEGRHPAAHSGLGAWVGARVASPRCPILRPGGLSVSHRAGARQRRSPWPRLAAVCRPSPIRLSWGTREPPQPAEFRAGVMSTTTRRARNGPGVLAQALAAEPSVGLLPGGAHAFGCHGSLPYKTLHDYICVF